MVEEIRVGEKYRYPPGLQINARGTRVEEVWVVGLRTEYRRMEIGPDMGDINCIGGDVKDETVKVLPEGGDHAVRLTPEQVYESLEEIDDG